MQAPNKWGGILLWQYRERHLLYSLNHSLLSPNRLVHSVRF